MTKSTAVAVRTKRELAPLSDRMERAANTGRQARSPATLRAYASRWRKFEAWCAAQFVCSQCGEESPLGVPRCQCKSAVVNLDPLPADIATLVLYADHLVKDEDCSISHLGQAFAALRYRHNMAQLPKEQRPDWQDIRLLEMLKASRRDISGRKAIKRAKPLSREDMRDAFDLLDVDTLRERRDLAVMVLAYAGCRRRSEITGLDYAKRGDNSNGTGILEITQEGVWIILLRSKTHQEGEPKKYFINRKLAGKSCAAIEAWIKMARIEPGTPVLRGLSGVGKKTGELGITHHITQASKPYEVFWPKGKYIGTYASLVEAVAARNARAAELGLTIPIPIKSGRYHDRRIAVVIQDCMFRILCRRLLANSKRKRLREEDIAACKAEAKEYSGHSGRRGSLRDHFENGGTRADAIAMSGHVPGSAMLDQYSLETDAKKHQFMRGSGL